MKGLRSELLLSFLTLSSFVTIAWSQYPVDASWFADRWTTDDWVNTLTEFQSQGGSIVWKRGANFRLRPGGGDEINNDPDYVWCTALEDCVDNAISTIEDAGLVVGNWFTYANNEEYDDNILLKCPGWDIMINSSRIYHRLIVPHDEYDESWNCTFYEGQTADIIFTLYNGIDPHALLLDVADELGVSVYMPQPCIPSYSEQLPAYYEFNSRVMSNYEARYSEHESFKGVYQTNEAWLGNWYEYLCEAYAVVSKQVHKYGRQFVISPYVDANEDQVGNATVAQHKAGFKAMAISGCDVIAVQEGRGCAKGSYWWKFQKNDLVADIDPVLNEICLYLSPTTPEGRTYAQQFSASNQLLFESFEEAVNELAEIGIETELWLNLEAFEYLRDAPCLPVDTGGNGMAELLDRTTKARIDWGLTAAGSRPTKIISFAWDADYLCTDGGYTSSLHEEILADYDRPIVSYFDGSTNVLGFNIANTGTVFNLTCSSGSQYVLSASSFDTEYGSNNNRSPLLQQATIPFASCTGDKWICISAANKATGKMSYHEWCYES